MGRRTDRLAVLLVLASWVALALVTSASTLWDRDEPRFARATVEMIESGNYLYPTFRGALRPDKPILVYWLMSIPVRLFGPVEWAVRSWSPIAAAIAGLLTFSIGRRLFSARAGIFAAAMLLSSPLLVFEGTAATVDALLLACTTAATAVLAAGLLGRSRPVPGLAGLAVLLALAQLAKGPVGLIPVLGFAATLAVLRPEERPSRGYRVGVVLAAAASVGLFAAWFLPADAATDGDYLRLALGRHVVARIEAPMEHHGGSYLASLPFYVPVVLFGFAPWSLYLPAAIARGRLAGRPARALLLGWSGAWFVVMTLVATKLPHYVLPLWPALALACGATLQAASEGRLDERERRWLARGGVLLALVLAAEVALLLAAPGFARMPDLRAPCAVVAGILAFAGGWALLEHRRGRHLRSAALLFLGAWAVYAGVAALILPKLEARKVVPGIAAAIRARTDRDVPVACLGYHPSTLEFYIDRPPIEDLRTPEDLARWLRRATAGVLVVPRSRIPAGSADELARAEPIADLAGFDFEKGEPIELLALGRNLRPLR